MKNIFFPALFIAFLFSIGACTKDQPAEKRELVQIDLTGTQKSLVMSNNAFGFDMFRAINKEEDPDKNIFISPLSISLSLAMTYNGADGDTKTEMQNTLRFPDLSAEEINGYFQTLCNALTDLDPTVKLGIANSIWYHEGFSVLPDFISINQLYYNAEVRALNFSDPASVKTINGWVASKTNNKIPKVIDEITDDLVMFLINAIYFKGQWTYDFNKDQTAPGTFHLSPVDETTVPFMHRKGTFHYYSDESLQLLEMPYGQGNFSMVVLLPKQGYSVSDLAESLTPEVWNSMLADTASAHVDIAMPRFKFDYERVLNNDLKGLGMVKAFGPADFSKINPLEELYISFVKHKSFVDVNEEGTEAAAVTVVGISTTSAGPEPVTFTADHPFIFAIRETTTNTILFMGKVTSL
jgi:serpin B